MNKIGAQYVFDLRQYLYNQSFSDYKKLILRDLERKLSDEIFTLLGKLQPDEYLVLFQPEYIDRTNVMSPEVSFPNITINLEVKTDIGRVKPYFLTTVKYKGEIVIPIEELSFWQRMKFVFTGKYPK